MLSILCIIILSYIIGSIPTAIIAGKIKLKDDIRNFGSGNAGATNVFRVMGWKPALIVILIDIGKGLLVVLLITKLRFGNIPLNMSILQIVAGCAAIIGHIWTIFAGFRGGKGVGTAFGVFLGLTTVPALVAFGVWLIIVLLTKYVSLGSIIGGVSLPVALYVEQLITKQYVHPGFYFITISLALLIVVTHRGNIIRLVQGCENKIGQKAQIQKDVS